MTFSALPGKVAAAHVRLKYTAALVLGVVMALGQAPVGWPVVAFGALVGTFWLFLTLEGIKRAAIFGWLFGSGYFLAALHWIVFPFFVDAAHQAWMAPFALFFMATGLALFWSPAFALAHWVGNGRAPAAVALAFSLTLAELARSYLLTGFPWGLLGYVWLDTPLIQSVRLIGPHGMGLITALAAALLVQRQWTVWRFAGAGGLLGLALVYGLLVQALAKPPSPVTAQPEPVHLRLVQPNAPQDQKWNPAMAATFFRRQLSLSQMPAAVSPDLVIWSETAVTFWLNEEPELQAIIAQSGAGATVILGAVREEAGQAYNSLAVLGRDGQTQQTYDKSHLVPFGEYIPFGDFLAGLGIHGLAAREGNGFSAGPGPRLLDLGRAGKVLPLICYEAIFPQLVNSWTERPDWILQITNDAWFGHWAGPRQHLAQARVRAIEQGLPLVRVANTGITAVIDPFGRITAELPLDAVGKLDADLPTRAARTIYSRTGDWPVLVLSLFGLILMARRRPSI